MLYRTELSRHTEGVGIEPTREFQPANCFQDSIRRQPSDGPSIEQATLPARKTPRAPRESFRGESRNRTGVNGFAGRYIATLSSRHMMKLGEEPT